jgi:hypothetical protein
MADLGGIAIFREVARQLYPHLSARTEPSELLERAAARGGFYDWADEDVAALEAVRREALELAAELVRRTTRPAG